MRIELNGITYNTKSAVRLFSAEQVETVVPLEKYEKWRQVLFFDYKSQSFFLLSEVDKLKTIYPFSMRRASSWLEDMGIVFDLEIWKEDWEKQF